MSQRCPKRRIERYTFCMRTCLNRTRNVSDPNVGHLGRLEYHSFVCILESMTFSKIFILPVYRLNCNIVLEGLIRVLEASYVALDIPKVLNPLRRVVHIDALDIGFCLSYK